MTRIKPWSTQHFRKYFDICISAAAVWLVLSQSTLTMVTITEKAKQRILTILAEEKYDDTYFIRVAVESGGCSGLSYRLNFDNEEKKGDQLFEDKGIKICLDIKSYLYLAGTELDYSDGLNGKGFEFHNPNASRTCACGESFAV